MMEFFVAIIFLLIFLTLVVGVFYLLYILIRKTILAFAAKRFWAGGMFLLFSLLMGGAVLYGVFTFLTMRTYAHRASCSSNLKMIVLFLKMYANDNQDGYPSTFDGLSGTNLMRVGDAGILACPSSHTKAGALTNVHSWTDYAYVSGLSEADPVGCVVAFCSPENHEGEGANVGFIGGQVQWFSCHSPTNAVSYRHDPTFQELTSNPALFYGTTDEKKLADLKKRTRIIWPKEGQ